MSGRVIRRLSIAIILAVAALQAGANIASGLQDRAGTGVAPWEVWTWELTSLAVWATIWPLIWIAVDRLRPPRFAWPVALLLHALCTVPVSALHVAGMIALREGTYALMGSDYYFGPLGFVGLYEYRKDTVTYCILALVFSLVQWRAALADAAGSPPPPDVIDVRDGAVTHRLPMAEIDLVESAGNYVELHWRGRTLLHRVTLAEMEAQLAPHGFARIHRTRLVRRAAIRRVETRQSGDFDVTLENGAVVKGSRRYRL